MNPETPLVLALLAFAGWSFLICVLARRRHLKLWAALQGIYLVIPAGILTYEAVTAPSGDKAFVGAFGLFMLALLTALPLFLLSRTFLKNAASVARREREEGFKL